MITGRTIREALSGAEGVDPWTLALMFAADRHEHLERPRTGIRALLAGDVRVVSDRYLFSSLAYQGALVDFSRVERINHAFPLPEHLIFIDTPRSETERRMAARPTRDRMETTEVQSLVSERYRAIIESFADNSKTRVHMIDGRGSEAEVARRVWHSVRPTG
jgi:dTMP kinase